VLRRRVDSASRHSASATTKHFGRNQFSAVPRAKIRAVEALTMKASTTWELYYWPEIQGRGEFVRLALEEAGIDYIDLERSPEAGTSSMTAFLEGEDVEHLPFAPPFVKVGTLLIGQTANILMFIGSHSKLAPADEAGRLWANQLQLTIADFLQEIHDTHHPIGGGLYYEDQKKEARRRTADFLENRVPKYLDYFERVLERNPRGSEHLVGATLTYPDLSLFQIVAGLQYAFPRGIARQVKRHPLVWALHDRVAARPRIASYLASDRRIAFNQQGIFRYYRELDA
jgi:glutathione S-transferase